MLLASASANPQCSFGSAGLLTKIVILACCLPELCSEKKMQVSVQVSPGEMCMFIGFVVLAEERVFQGFHKQLSLKLSLV